MFKRVPEKMSMVLLLMILVFSGCSILYISFVTTNALKEQTRNEIQRLCHPCCKPDQRRCRCASQARG